MTVKIQNCVVDARRVESTQDALPVAQFDLNEKESVDERNATLRHDMVNCLTAMQLQLEVMRRRQILNDIQIRPLSQSLSRMEMLIRDWRQLSDGNSHREDCRIFNLAEIVRKLVAANAPRAVLKGQELTEHLESTSAMLVGHESEIQRAVDNLISNAIKYTPEGGTIAVSLMARDGWAILSILDNGIGIPDDEQERVFAAYYRAQNARKSGVCGTGLGLSQVKNAVEQHGGTLRLHSKYGHGTLVEIDLPLTHD